jgi:methylmalonyl-CoA mutase cobalamin-binding domain/chain
MLGLDVHTKGIRTLASRLREYGCEVAFLGEHLTPGALASGALTADVDVIGVSFSSGAYIDHCRDLLEAMRNAGVGHIPLMVGGLVHQDDHAQLKAMGIKGIFGPGSQIEDIVAFIAQVAKDRITGGTDETEEIVKP